MYMQACSCVYTCTQLVSSIILREITIHACILLMYFLIHQTCKKVLSAIHFSMADMFSVIVKINGSMPHKIYIDAYCLGLLYLKYYCGQVLLSTSLSPGLSIWGFYVWQCLTTPSICRKPCPYMTYTQ